MTPVSAGALARTSFVKSMQSRQVRDEGGVSTFRSQPVLSQEEDRASGASFSNALETAFTSDVPAMIDTLGK
jgi:hypothetical protein